MHFAFAITEYFPYGGAQRDFIAVVNEMARRGHQISVITLKWHGDIHKDWTLYELGKSQSTNHGRIKALSGYVVSLKKQGLFDAIIGFTKLAGLDVYFAADPCFTANRFKGLNRLLPRYRTYAGIEKNLFGNPNLKAFYLTEHQRQQYQQSFDLKQDNQALLPVSVEEKFHFTQARWEAARDWRQQAQQAENRILLLFVAADFHTKGLDRIIAALSALSFVARSQFELWIVGNGKQAAYERKLQRLTGLNFRFWGGQTELAPFYFAADLLVHPARKEAAGMVLAEAAAARLPMLISDICGYAFLAEQEALSHVLDEKHCISELTQALNLQSKQPEALPRTEPNPLVSAASRAVFCADKIEAWCN
ncbi:glycosyltransferase family 4 protein [Methylophaga sp.]|uniref:glycosyltransferase family 4 protein n=1 Tax=Methylophaga sp. TaxID=2024840 RepID=UPI001401A014|nr:glycosyltransferase family 4 protein [Methylophaga sp.]MTI63684.1 glycosyltransferase family 4 protein [Methylophaga sp.]